MEIVVRLDDRGRILIPRELRKLLPSHRMILKKLGEDLVLSPLPDPKSFRGKYRISGKMAEVEEDQERVLLRRK